MARKEKKKRDSVVFSNSPISNPPESNPEIVGDASEEQQPQDHTQADDARVVSELDFTPDVPAEMAQEVWEALREEFFEQLEQLPLSLHRSFAIIGEQDKEAEACQAELLPTIRSYVKLRQSLRGNASSTALEESDRQYPQAPLASSVDHDYDSRVEESGSVALDQATKPRHTDTSPEGEVKGYEPNEGSQIPHKEEELDVIMEDVSSQQNGVTSGSRPPANTQSPTRIASTSRGTSSSRSPDNPPPSASSRPQGLRETDATVPKSVPFPPRPKPKTTRELLTRISFLMGELVRASEEKVGLATAAYDSVDRHVRALDAAIKEHEAAVTLGLREGTRPVGAATSEENDPTLSKNIDEDDEEPQLGMIGPSASTGGRPTQRSSRNKKRDRRDQRRHVIAEKPAVRLNVPPPSNVNNIAPPAHHDMPIDPHEPRYCYCHQVSYGEVRAEFFDLVQRTNQLVGGQMIACDNPDCSREWFHLGCAGLAAPPKGKVKWYCRDCEEALGRNKRRKLR